MFIWDLEIGHWLSNTALFEIVDLADISFPFNFWNEKLMLWQNKLCYYWLILFLNDLRWRMLIICKWLCWWLINIVSIEEGMWITWVVKASWQIVCLIVTDSDSANRNNEFHLSNYISIFSLLNARLFIFFFVICHRFYLLFVK